MAGFCVYPPPGYSQRTLITVFAVASQVEEIVVDGDLSDWSGDLPRYPVKHLGSWKHYSAVRESTRPS